MRRLFLLPACFLSVFLLAGASSAAENDKAFVGLLRSWFGHSHVFSDPRIGPAGHLQVTATPVFLEAPSLKKKEALQRLAEDWRKAHVDAGVAVPEPLLLEVQWSRGGWLWAIRQERGGAVRVAAVDRWDDTAFVWMPETGKNRWFLFLGGQSSSGGSIGSSSGFNLRLGTTLFRDKYDVAFLFNQTSTGPAPKTKATIYGVVARILIRGKNRWGYNVGTQLTSISSSGADTNMEVSGILGANYYMPQGTWDASLAIGDEGSRTVVLGYSLFLSR